jgi:hypothetical protein
MDNNYVPEWIRQNSALWASLVPDKDNEQEQEAADALARDSGMPVCDEDCADGAQMLRVADYWCVAHDALHTASFCRAWFAVSAEARAALLASQTNVPPPPNAQQAVVPLDPVLSAASLTAAAVALDDAALLASIPFGATLRDVRMERLTPRLQQVSPIQDMCLRHDAVRCITLVGFSTHMVHGLEPAARAGAAKILRLMLQGGGAQLLPQSHVERLVLAAMCSAGGARVLDVVLSEPEFPEHFQYMQHELAYKPGRLMEVAVACGHWDVFCWMLRAVRAAQAAANKQNARKPVPYDPAALLLQLVIDRRTTEIARLQAAGYCGWRFYAASHQQRGVYTIEDGMAVSELAARYGRLDVLAWAKKTGGCPWDKDALMAAARSARTRAAICKMDMAPPRLLMLLGKTVAGKKRKIAFVIDAED